MIRSVQPLLSAVETALNTADRVGGSWVVGIDGRCGAGKSTLARAIYEHVPGSSVIAMDDFFLPAAMQTPERLADGNAHWERFLDEISAHLRTGEPFSYRRYDCAAGDYAAEPVAVPAGRLRVVEGSYALHPRLRTLYDWTVFCDADAETRRARLLAREGPEGLARFEERWIPLEEAYFTRYNVRQTANFIVTL